MFYTTKMFLSRRYEINFPIVINQLVQLVREEMRNQVKNSFFVLDLVVNERGPYMTSDGVM